MGWVWLLRLISTFRTRFKGRTQSAQLGLGGPVTAMYTMLEQVTELNLVMVASSYRKIAPGVRKVVLIGGWYRPPINTT